MKKLVVVFAALACCSCSFTQDKTVFTPVLVISQEKEPATAKRQKTCIYVPPDVVPMKPFDIARYDAIPSSAITQKMMMLVTYIEYLRRRDVAVQDGQIAALTIYNNCLHS